MISRVARCERGGDASCDVGHLFFGKCELATEEIEILFGLHRHEVDVGVWHLQSEYHCTDLYAGHGFLQCLRHMLGKTLQSDILIVGKIKDIVNLAFWNDQYVTRGDRIDVEKCEMVGVFRNLIAGNLAGSDA